MSIEELIKLYEQDKLSVVDGIELLNKLVAERKQLVPAMRALMADVEAMQQGDTDVFGPLEDVFGECNTEIVWPNLCFHVDKFRDLVEI